MNKNEGSLRYATSKLDTAGLILQKKLTISANIQRKRIMKQANIKDVTCNRLA